MTEIEYKNIDDGIDKATESTTPFPILDDEMVVVGDANNTELNKHDFNITFLVPGDGGYKRYDKEYKDVYITPRQQVRINKTIAGLMPYFRKPLPDGNTGKYADEEKRKIVEEFSDEINDSMYDLVSAVLKIDPALADYMTLSSVIDAATKIILMYPEMMNEADTFFK